MMTISILLGMPIVACHILTSTHGWVKFSSWVFMVVCTLIATGCSIFMFALTSSWVTVISMLISVIVWLAVMYLCMAALIIIFGFMLARELNQ